VARCFVNTRTEDNADPMLKVLAWLGHAALGLSAVLNAVIAGTLLIGGQLIGAVGEASEKLHDADLANSANHAALIAKIVAVAFGVLAATEYGAAIFLKKRIRTVFIPITCGLTVAAEVGFSIWSKRFNALDAVIIACCMFAAYVWWKLPRRATAAAV